MEKTIDTAPPSTEAKTTPKSKLPKVKKPPSSVLDAVVRRAENKSTLARFSEKTAPLVEAKRAKERAAKREAVKVAKASTQAGDKAVVPQGYWAKRKDSVYLKAAREMCGRYLRQGDAVIDVGSNRTPTLTWHRKKARRLVSVDLRNPYRGKGVEPIAGDFFDYPSDPPFELVTCFQVLEHVPDAHAFAQKLLATGKTCVVSVPYRWPKGKCKWHIHDPVDEVKMLGWFGKAPLETFIAREETANSDRLICVYEGSPGMAVPAPKVRQPLEKTGNVRGWFANIAAKLKLGKAA
jgi:hypothetical protein